MRRALALTLVAALAFGGCLAAGSDPATPADTNATLTVDSARPEPVFTDIPDARLGTRAAPDAAATLDAPPKLQEGEWWRIELHDTLTDNVTQFIRVVARVEEDQYVIGMPHEGWWKEAVIFHTPAFGDVGLDLSHRAHDIPFQPLQFPLTDGATWQTAWESPAPVTAKVKVESPTTARITFTGTTCGPLGIVGQCPNPGQGQVAELLYDATVHEVTEAKFPSHTWTVIDHGYGYEGWITVPRGEHLVFFHGRLGAPAFDFVNGAPATPVDKVTVNGGFNRVSFILAVGDILASGAGAYSEKATSPDGKTFEMTALPGASGGLKIGFFEHSKPDGEWSLEHIVAGGGIVFAEGIAYHQYDIQLPSGNMRSDHNHEVVR